MASSSIEPFLKGNTGRNTRGLLRIVILLVIAAAAVSSRLFSVISTWSHMHQFFLDVDCLSSDFFD